MEFLTLNKHVAATCQLAAAPSLQLPHSFRQAESSLCRSSSSSSFLEHAEYALWTCCCSICLQKYFVCCLTYSNPCITAVGRSMTSHLKGNKASVSNELQVSDSFEGVFGLNSLYHIRYLYNFCISKKKKRCFLNISCVSLLFVFAEPSQKLSM